MNILTVNRRRAILFLVAAAVLWSTGGLLIKIIDWHPLAIAGGRSAVAAVAILIITRRRPFLTWSFPQVGGALCYAGTVALFVAATKLTTAANAILLQYTAPIYIALFGYRFLKERTTRFDWLIVTATLGGMCLFFLDDLAAGGAWGNCLAILSGISFAGLILCMRKQKDGSPLETVILGNIFTVLICLPFILSSTPPGPAGWFALLLLGFFQLGLSYVLYAAAVKSVTALEAVLVPVIEPLLNPVWVFLFLGEIPGPWAILGGAMVIGSITAYSSVKAIPGVRP